jgi:hypothetical protein
MSKPSAEPRCTAIVTTLETGVGGTTNIRSIAEATIEPWPAVAARLEPIIGVRGVDVLYGRALQQTAMVFPWLVTSEKCGNSAALPAGLKARLAGQEPAIAAEASLALRFAFTELLATLIGTSLTQRLLGPVWASPSPAIESEQNHE